MTGCSTEHLVPFLSTETSCAGHTYAWDTGPQFGNNGDTHIMIQYQTDTF